MKICIKNCTLISMDLDREKIECNMDILLEDNKISKIGKNIDISGCDKVIDATDKIVLPGLINTHAHIPMSIFRETLEGYTLQDWLTKKIWPMEDNLQSEDVYYASWLTCIEMIKTGTTTINDMYFICADIIRAVKESGVRCQIGRCLMGDLDPVGLAKFDEQRKIMEDNKDESRLTFTAAVHSFYTVPPAYLEKCKELIEEKNLPIHMHFCENAQELEDIKRIYNKKPIELLKEHFGGKRMLLAHCVKLNEEEIQTIADLHASVAHCPVSNLKLGCGIANISEMMKKGINVSLGTDGQGSGCNLDLFETMRMASLLQKGINENPDEMPAYEVLKMATVNGAKALGLEDEIGSIKENKLADIIILDIDDVKIKPVNNLIAEIVHNVNSRNVITTIVDGKILMEDRKLIVDNEKEIADKCNTIFERISNNI